MTSELKGIRPMWPSWLTIGVFCFAVILAVLLPALMLQMRRGHRAQCMSNERQVLLAILMYADDYQASPMDSTNPTLVGSMQLLSNYTGSAKVASYLFCPDDHRPGAQSATDFKKLTTLNISYSYVPNLKWHDKSDSPVIMDRIYSTAKGSAWPNNGNHRGEGGNVGFTDGHLEWKERLPAALEDKDGKEVVLSP